MNAQERAKILVSRFRKGSLPYDMEQWACYAIMNAEKQAQVEVLAACIRRIEHLRGKWSQDDDRAQWALIRAGEELEELQPAAKDLEELLRKAKLEEHKAVCADCNAVVEADWPRSTKFKLPKPCQRLAELEKARAKEGKP